MAKKTLTPGRAPEVDALLATLHHPLQGHIEALRALVLGVDPRIGEGVKWNAPSFHLTGAWFATVHLRSTDVLKVVLHLGAQVRAVGPEGLVVDDPTGLLTWPAKDRALLTVADVGQAHRAIEAVVRSWIALVEGSAS